jgi:pyrroloquinoline quinone biosynthesis protein E
MPTRAQVEQAAEVVERLRNAHRGRIVIDAVVADYYARYPKPCLGGWGRRSLNVTPAGKVLPCHAAETIPGLEFWNVRERSLAEIWGRSPAFMAFRGTDWMKEPCRSCLAGRRISAAAAARLSHLQATRRRPTRCASSHRNTISSRRSPK